MCKQQTKLQMAVLLVVVLALASSAAAQNLPPVADAGEDQTTYIGYSPMLDGSATDPNNDPIVGWLWTVESAPEGSSPYIDLTDVPTPYFAGDIAGDYVLSLIAADALVWSEPDYVTIHVVELLPPVAVATADVTSGPAPLTVQFDGSQSYDPQGGSLYYDWDFGDGALSSSEVSPTHTYAAPGIFAARLTISDTRGQSDFDTIVITVTPGGNIQVSPDAYDFGDVELGSSSSTIITITNPLGGTYEDPLELLDVSLAAGGSGDFAITANPAGSVVLPGESVDVGVAFAPSAEGYVSATLQISSDDPVFPLIEVALGGVGVYEELPPDEQVAAVLTFIEDSVAAGTLAGDGPGRSAENRLSALENMIEAAGDLIEDGLYDEACDQLAAALKKCDGEPNPPDFVTGDAASALADMIGVLRTTLGCQ